MRNVAVLGSTGSIGLATIDVVRNLGEGWRVWGLSGHAHVAEMAEVVASLEPPPAVIVGSDPESFEKVPRETWPAGSEIRLGPDGLVALAESDAVDTVVAAIVGRAGLESTLAAVRSGKRVALANKETLVVAGSIVYEQRRHSRAEILPVDSEHSAIYQCMAESKTSGRCEPKKLILTASGGPFRDWTQTQMREATVKDALNHPTWQMGPKITIDSATMMNKALEIIEARWLFDMPAEQIEVVIHPQSIIHSMVEFEDSSVIAQLSPPDMRLPIQYALTYPERLPCPAPALDRQRRWDLTIEPADAERFPALGLGFEVAAAGGTAGAVVNAANEAAVGLFLKGQIRFTDIVPACRLALENHEHEEHPSLDRLLELDRWARAEVRRWHCGAKS